MIKRIVFVFMIVFSCIYAGEFHSSIGPQFYYISLENHDSQKLDGYMAGVDACVDYDYSCMRAGVQFNGAWDTNYLRGDPCLKCSASEYFLTARIGFVKCWVCDQFPAYLYSGFGWHQFENTHYPESISFCMRYDKLFIPLGVSFSFPCWFGGEIGFNFEWRPDVYSKLKFDSNSVDNSCEHGVHIEIPFNWSCHTSCGQVFSKLSPLFDWAQFGMFSEGEDVMFVIPSSKRWELGISWQVGFNF